MMDTGQLRMYLELDVLLDTRLAILRQLPVPFPENFPFQDYRERICDDYRPMGLLDIDRSAFLTAYRKRTSQLLPLSPMTGFIDVLKDIISKYLREKVSGPNIKQLTIDINFSPYQIDETVKNELLDTIRYLIGDVCKVSGISIPYQLLTPMYVRTQYDMVAMYDFDQWSLYHFPSLQCHELHFVNFIVPALVTEQFSQEALAEMEIQDLGDLFTTVKTVLAPTINVEFITANAFSIIDHPA